MGSLNIKYKDEYIYFHSNDPKYNARIKTSPFDLEYFEKWIESYNNAVNHLNSKKILLNIGKEIYEWINDKNNWFEKYLVSLKTPLFIVLQIPRKSTKVQKAFIEVPWEIIADENNFLALNPNLGICPIRCIGEPDKNKRPKPKYILKTIFMASSPVNTSNVLAFEEEESSILNMHAEKCNNMNLYVEESGNLNQLVNYLNKVRPIDVVHISCHGDIDYNNIKKPEPILYLETNTGNSEKINGERFTKAFNKQKPKLLILSSCRSSEAFSVKQKHESKYYTSFAQSLVKNGFQAVIGWSGRVGDKEATRFSGELYKKLAQGETVENATMIARNALSIPPKNNWNIEHLSKDWHLARLYLGPFGGGSISGKINMDPIPLEDKTHKQFIDKKGNQLQIASRNEFVGRRRYIQKILKEIYNKEHAGIFIYGLGKYGKSSLAGRVASRLYDYDPVLIYGRKKFVKNYLIINIINEIKNVANSKNKLIIKNFINEIKNNSTLAKTSLVRLLEGPFSGGDKNQKPILLIIDDMENIMSSQNSNQKYSYIQEEFESSIIDIIKAFGTANTKSRLILTNRFDFVQNHINQNDILLLKLPLGSLNKVESEKQFQAKYYSNNVNNNDLFLEKREIIELSQGNPGIQNYLHGIYQKNNKQYKKIKLFLKNYHNNVNGSRNKIINDLIDSIGHEKLLNQLTHDEIGILQKFSIFNAPVPEEIYGTLLKNINSLKKNEKINKLKRLGIIEQHWDYVNSNSISLLVNRYVKSVIHPPSKNTISRLSKTFINDLYNYWYRGTNHQIPPICDIELLKFGLSAENVKIVKTCFENSIIELEEIKNLELAKEYCIRTIKLLEKSKNSVPIMFYKVASEICLRGNSYYHSIRYINKAVAKTKNFNNALTSGSVFFSYGKLMTIRGRYNDSIIALNKSVKYFLEAKFLVMVGRAYKQIAGIYIIKGKLNKGIELHKEALRIFYLTGDMISTANQWQALGEIYERIGNNDRSKEAYDIACDIMIDTGDIYLLPDIYSIWAKQQTKNGDFDKALELLESAKKISLANKEIRTAAGIRKQIGNLYLSMWKTEEAKKELLKASDMYKKSGDINGELVTNLNLGKVYSLTGEINKATDIYLKCFERYKSQGALQAMGTIQLDLAENYSRQKNKNINDTKQILQLLSAAKDIFINIEDIKGIALANILIARNLNNGKKNNVLKLLKDARKKLVQLGEEKYSAFALLEIAQITLDKGEIDVATKQLEEVADIANKYHDPNLKGMSLLFLADTKQNTEDIESSFKLYLESYSIFRKTGDLYGETSALFEIAYILYDEGYREKAYHAFNELLNKYKIIGDRKGQIEVLNDMAKIESSRGDYEKSTTTYLSLIEMCHSENEFEEKIKYYIDLIINYFLLGDEQKAMKYYEKACLDSEKINNLKLKTVITIKLAESLESQNRLETALKFYRSAILETEKHNFYENKIDALGGIARIHQANKKLEDAIKIYKDIIKIAEDKNDLDNVIKYNCSLASMYRTIKKHEKSMGLYEYTLQIARKNDQFRNCVFILYELAKIAESEINYKKSIDLFVEALEIAREKSYFHEQALVLWKVSIVHIKLKQFQKAYDYLNESYQINKDLGQIEGISSVGLDLGELLCRSGHYKKGIEILNNSLKNYVKQQNTELIKSTKNLIYKMEKLAN